MGVRCLLSLLERCAQASPLTNFNLAWKTTTLLVLVTAKYCADSMLLSKICNLFFGIAFIFFPANGAKMDEPDHLPPQIHIESHSNVNLCPVLFEGLIMAY